MWFTPVSTVDSVLQQLTALHPEYARRPQVQLRKNISLALVALREEAPVQSESNSNNNNNNNNNNEKEDSDDDDDDDAEGPSANLMNATVLRTYNAGSGSSVSAVRAIDTGAAVPKKQKTGSGQTANDKRPSKAPSATSVVAASEKRETLRYSDVGGIEHCLQDIRELIEHPIRHPEIYKHLGVLPPTGVLLHGPSGTGKTLLAHAIAGELGVPFFSISAPEIVSGFSGQSERRIRQLFVEAQSKAPALVFIDEIDAITPKRESAQREMERRIVAQLLTCMDDLARGAPTSPEDEAESAVGAKRAPGDAMKIGSSGSSEAKPAERTLTDSPGPVIVIGATNRPDALDPALRRAGRFDREILMGVPDAPARARILRVLCKKLRLDGDFDFETLGRRTPGFVGADLVALTKEAATIAVNRIFHDLFAQEEDEQTRALAQVPVWDRAGQRAAELKRREGVAERLKDAGTLSEEQLAHLSITMDDFVKALANVQPSSKREGFATVPDVTWADIGALENVRRELQMAIVNAIRFPDAYSQLGLAHPAGVLLYGPPGCGKTLLARAVANECQASFISIKGPELLNKYVGESERAVRQVFQRARASSPCVVFFDELDALAPRRGGESQASERVVNQLLTELDGLDSRKDVFVIAATNRPDIIDAAMLRPGRLEKLLYVPLPTESDRLNILRTLTKHRPMLAPGVNLQKVAKDERCTGFSGADLAALVREAAMAALSEVFSGGEQPKYVPKSEQLCVNEKHFEVAFTKIAPSVSPADAKRYEAMQRSLRGKMT